MQTLKTVCNEMAKDSRILTFSEIARSAAKGAILGQKANAPIIGAILNVSLQAGERAVTITKDMLAQLKDQDLKTRGTCLQAS